MTYDLENNMISQKGDSTLNIKVNHQDQVTKYGFSEIPDIENV